MAFFGAIGFLRKCTLKVRYILLTYVHTPKKTAKIPLEIGSRFETYFQWSSKTGPCIFLDQAKYRAKYSYLWYLTTGLRRIEGGYIHTYYFWPTANGSAKAIHGAVVRR